MLPAAAHDARPAAIPAPVVYVVLLNWNGWHDTIECLESVFRLRGVEVVAVVCDNASADGSMAHITAWAQGDEAAARTPFLDNEPVGKPIVFTRLGRAEAESGAGRPAPLVLIDTGANLGFAGGCNVGIRYALTQPDCSHVWLLNNDAVAAPDALAEMLALCRVHPRIGICGNQVRYYDAPQRIQTFGGLLNAWVCTTHTLHGDTDGASVSQAPSHIDYVPGASMLVTRAFLDRVGLMSESYFLYFEEIDWAERGKAEFDLAVCPRGLVYHRGASSIGSPREGGERGARSEYYLLRGRVVFARKFYPLRLPWVYLGLFISLANRLRRRQWRRARIALCAVAGVRPAVITLTRQGN